MKAGIVGALAFVGALVATAAWAGGPKVGQPAPDFQVETFDGRHLKLGDLKGQVVI
ncbi:MAG: hypothetical protein JF605_25170, partial [Burkholderia sp.]|nr:hypothetical protein [Burkholderia sp.]